MAEQTAPQLPQGQATSTPIGDLGQWAQSNIGTYGGKFAQAYQALGQPVTADPNGKAPFAINTDADRQKDTTRLVYEGILSLAVPFTQEFQKANGRPPTEQELNGFVAQNLNSTHALNFIQGNVNQETARPMVQEVLKTQMGETQAGQSQRDFLEGSLKDSQTGYENQTKNIDQQILEAQRGTRTEAEAAYGQELRRQNKEASAMGTLYQPNRQENVNRSFDTFSQGLAKAVANIQGQGLQAKSAANQGLMDRLQGNKQFAANLGIQNRSLDLTARGQNMTQQNTQNQSILDMIQNQQNRTDAYAAGRAQAEANKPGALDFVNTGIKGLNAVANTVTAFKKK